MSPLAIVLVLISCVSHATWNLWTKQSSKGLNFFLLGSLGVLAAGLPVFWLWDGAGILQARPELFVCLAVTGCFQAAYYLGLVKAYRLGDISVVYPLVRTTPIFVLLLAGTLRGLWPAWPAAVGIVLVVFGCFLLPWQPGKGIRLKDYLNRASAWAIFAALASSGYTLIDDLGMSYMVERFPRPQAAFLYGYLEWLSSTVALALGARLVAEPETFRRVWTLEARRALTVGLLIFGTYLLILWAYSLSTQVSYVAAMRQFSIVLGVLAGITLLKESGGRTRILASAVIVVGLILIGLSAARGR
ncbi:MAG: hypothetical protein AMXMBFR7_52820 [Planctomycetota bacterium]